MRLALPALPALLALVLALPACRGTGSDAMASGAPGSFVMVDLKPGAEDIKAVLKAEAARAKADGHKAYVELWATWCGPCKAIKDSLEDPRMKAAFKGTHIVKLDIDAWGVQKLSSAGLNSRSIPVFFALDEDGKVTGRKIDGGAWDENIPVNMAPPLDKFFHGG